MHTIKRVLMLIATLCCGCAFGLTQDAPNALRGKVISIENGNTLILSAENKKLRVRLIGIHVPSQVLGKQSRENLAALVHDKDVSVFPSPVELQEGKHKLLVGRVFIGNLDIGLEQIRSGFAWHSDEFEKYQHQNEIKLYSDAERVATEAKRGVWGNGFTLCKDAAVQTTVRTAAKPGTMAANLPKVSGTVFVEITVDEGGKVVSARALCGHPLLQTAAVRAVLQAKFKPQSYMYSGTVVYNFVPE
jgi:TonB family protein